MKNPLWALVLAFGIAGVLVEPAQGTPITYEFDVTATSGPLAGSTATGTFAFDSSIIPAGGGRVASPTLFSALSFSWDGIAYTESNTKTSSLTFDSSGNLIAWSFGTTCLPAGCLVRLIPPGFKDWSVLQSATQSFFEYGRPDLSFGFGTETVRPLAAVPEPASLALLGTGLLGICRRVRGRQT